VIGIVLGSPDTVFRRALAGELSRLRELHLLADTGTPKHLHLLVATQRPSLVVFDAHWMQACPDLLGRLQASPVSPKILLHADTLDRPEILAAVKQGVHGCLPRESSPATWHRAILAIHAGEPWIPRALMAHALDELQHLLQTRASISQAMEQLTQRQREIVRWVSQGLSNKEIGRHLGISPTTVKTHLHNIFERAGVNGRQQLAARALANTAGMRPAARTATVH
jgi:two-component system nitrate/nitrite response regulator NarL